HGRAVIIIYGPAVVRVHQAKIPKLIALIDIRHTGDREFQEDLREAVIHSHPGDARLEGPKVRKEYILFRVFEHAPDKGREYSFVGRVGIDPTALELGFTHGLEHIVLDPLAVNPILSFIRLPKRPAADQRLIKQILVVRYGC